MKGRDLDEMLSLGCFRMHQDIFTCRYVIFNDQLYGVHWLRIVIDRVRYGPKQSRLLRINQNYSVAVGPLQLTNEIRALYARYRNSIDFDAPESVEACLLDETNHTAFDTRAVEVRDGDTLIAVGIFDNGDRSIAGIMNFYHPDYRKQSLGKLLMLLKINYARQQQKDYYYPGYLVSGYPKFDYKLFACEAATEVYDDQADADPLLPDWLPFSWNTIADLNAAREQEER